MNIFSDKNIFQASTLYIAFSLKKQHFHYENKATYLYIYIYEQVYKKKDKKQGENTLN